ncbi:hypothetical protein H696_04377 [Fonticula alba]|uniref:Uncharacterized protein n=1 Tax=Fonticula alba TaxID=691883 RepID=A0A058Z4Y8_FONAL|nr:hypothetical protein H696_04377 [Fonticula alba]KCV68958.1 hypothetical protein H696_04377 [Fonticula alba]|eukprot:XP_009496529.1 hypothetical protein H696_04377 [Fonticula alba]
MLRLRPDAFDEEDDDGITPLPELDALPARMMASPSQEADPGLAGLRHSHHHHPSYGPPFEQMAFDEATPAPRSVFLSPSQPQEDFARASNSASAGGDPHLAAGDALDESDARMTSNFFANTDHGPAILAALKTFPANDDSYVLLTMLRTGIRFDLEIQTSLLASLFIDRKFFTEFHCQQHSTVLVPLNTLIDCLSLFSASAPPGAGAQHGHYAASGEGNRANIPFDPPGPGAGASTFTPASGLAYLEITWDFDGQLMLNIFSNKEYASCAINTLHDTQRMHSILHQHQGSPATEVAVISMKAHWLRDAFHEMDTNSDVLAVRISGTEAPYFSFATDNVLSGYTEFSFPRSGRVIDCFRVSPGLSTVVCNFTIELARASTRALAISNMATLHLFEERLLRLSLPLAFSDRGTADITNQTPESQRFLIEFTTA